MTHAWTSARSQFDRRSEAFATAAWASRSLGLDQELERRAWDTYARERAEFQAAIDEVVAIAPETPRDLRDRLALAGWIMTLCHELDEAWLEAQAERISPLPSFPND